MVEHKSILVTRLNWFDTVSPEVFFFFFFLFFSFYYYYYLFIYFLFGLPHLCSIYISFYFFFVLGIRELSLISNDDLFLCKSGDEIRSLGDRCNIRPNCGDRSDERDCDQCKLF